MTPPLPSPTRQLWLIEQMDALVEDQGRDRFVAGTLLDPTHLPSDEAADAKSLARVLGTLLDHVGLGNLSVEVNPQEAHRGATLPWLEDTATRYRHDGPAWFEGIENGRCRFGADLRRLQGHPLSSPPLMGALAHQVAHAWRELQGLVVEDDDLEEMLTDLTGVYLGLGVLLLRGDWRSPDHGTPGVALGVRAPGSLSARDLAYLFGAQLAARETPKRELKRLLAHMPSERLGLVQGAVSHFRSTGRRALAELLETPEETEERSLEVPFAKGARPVQRVQRNRVWAGLGGGLGLGVAVALIGLASTANPQFIILTPFGAILGGLGGWLVRTSRCSNCSHPIQEDEILCGGCGGLITTRE